MTRNNRPDRPLVALGAVVLFAVGVIVPAHALPDAEARTQRSPIPFPAFFIANTGQIDPHARFYSIGRDHSIVAADDGLTLTLLRPVRPIVLRLAFVDAAAALRVEPAVPANTRVNYLTGASQEWRTNLPTFAEVRYRNVWAGIDASAAVQPGRLKYQFQLGPGANPSSIVLKYDGAERVRISSDGSLEINAAGATLTDRAPRAYQRIDGRDVPVAVAFALRGKDTYGFDVGRFDRTRPLVIDPTVVYSTLIGSSGFDAGNAIAVDRSGAAYVAGTTRYSNFPTTTGAFQTMFGGGTTNRPTDAFVAKVNASGTQFEYVTYLGGSGNDEALGIALGADGSAYVTGYSESRNFPTTAGVFRPEIGLSGHDGFLAKLNPAGSSLVYSTYFASSGRTDPAAVAVDAAGNAHVTGRTFAGNLPVTFGGNTASGTGQWDAFLLKFDPAGTQVTYGTYIGGHDADVGTGVAISAGGYTYVTGWTESMNRIAVAKAGTPVQLEPNSAIFKSTNGGQRFVPDNVGGWHAREVLAIAIDPQQPAIVYQGTRDDGLLKSTDGGAHWFQVGIFGERTVADLAINPNTPTTLLGVVSGTASGPFLGRSTDGGESWTFGPPNVGRVAFAPSDPAIAYATSSGLLRSANGGATWTAFVTPSWYPSSLAIDPSNANIVYLGADTNHVMKTTDGGSTWTTLTVNGAPPNLPIVSLAVDPTSSNVLWAGTVNAGLFKSSDTGNSWAYQPFAGASYPFRLVFDGPTLYVANIGPVSFSLATTSDQGASWSRLNIRDNVLPIKGLAAKDGTLFVGTTAGADGFLYKIDTTATTTSLMFGMYLGGSGDDFAIGLALDPSGNPVIALQTASRDLPANIAGDFRPSAIVRVAADGGSYIASSYIGASRFASATTGVAVDRGGIAYAAGVWDDGPIRIWISRVDQTGKESDQYSIAGERSNVDVATSRPNAIAVDAAGAVYITGMTNTIDFPRTDGAPQPYYMGGEDDAFISKIGFAPPPSGLPTPWIDQDVGSVGTPGSASFDNGVFTVGGAGTIWGNADQFNFVYQTISGDVTIIARLASMENGDTFAKAGIMIRESTAANASHVILNVRPTSDLEFMTRPSTGAETTFLGTASQPPPAWLRLVRTGTTITAAISADGANWNTIGSTTLNIGSSAIAGLVVGSNQTVADTATFDNVTITPGAPPSSWASQDIGPVPMPGSTSVANGTFTVKGSGTIWGTSDTFRFVYRQVSGDFHLVARVTSIENTNTFAKAGLMVRESLATGAAHVIFNLRPSNDLEFMTRPSTDQETTFLSTAIQPPPAWLKLERTGNTVIGSVSADGTAWNVVGTTTLPVGSSVYVGMVVCSVTTTLNTSTFDSVSIW